MKNSVMATLIVVGLLMAVYRFLPADIQHSAKEQLHLVAQRETDSRSNHQEATESSAPQKYTLVAPQSKKPQTKSGLTVAEAYLQRAQDVQVQGEGQVVKVLPDDNKGHKHQRFILRTSEGFTVLVAHNIDLARRIEKLEKNDTVIFFGEYVWNEKGGIVHWTHHDPAMRHVSGWLKHKDIVYQ